MTSRSCVVIGLNPKTVFDFTIYALNSEIIIFVLIFVIIFVIIFDKFRNFNIFHFANIRENVSKSVVIHPTNKFVVDIFNSDNLDDFFHCLICGFPIYATIFVEI